jgi:AcrR family transcriptional regulator
MVDPLAPSEPRVTERGRRTRDRIIAAAAELIYANGDAGTGIRDVRTAAGVSGSQMTLYFPTRASLIYAVIEYRSRQVVELTNQPDSQGLDSLEKLRAWTGLTIERLRERGPEGGCLLGSLVSQVAENDDAARDRIAVGFEDWIAALAAGLRKMQEAGEIGPDADPEALATSLMAALQGGYTLSQAARSTGPMEKALDAMIAYIETFAE